MSTPLPKPSDVRAEANRRREAYGINALRNRQVALGAELPPDMHYLGLQIDFVAERLCGLRPIPVDYRSDIYWPTVQVTS